MKKSIYILLFALFLGACDDGFDELNVNPAKPVQVSLSSKLTAAQKFMSSERYDNWRANLIYQSTMMQHIATSTKRIVPRPLKVCCENLQKSVMFQCLNSGARRDHSLS